METNTPPPAVWMQACKPTSYDEIRAIRPLITARLDQYIHRKDMPHLLLAGKEGIGKLTLATMFANTLLQNKNNIKIIFADDPITKAERDTVHKMGSISGSRVGREESGQRSLNVFIHGRILPFVTTAKLSPDPFRLIIIDNFDQLGQEQDAFRRLMEEYSGNCRMILIANSASSIIDPILSRCSTIFIPTLSPNTFSSLLIEKIQSYVPIFKDEIVANYLGLVTDYNIGKALQIAQMAYTKVNTIDRKTIQMLTTDPKRAFVISVLSKIYQTKQLTTALDELKRGLSARPISAKEFLRYMYLITMDSGLARPVKKKVLSVIAEADLDVISISNTLLYLEYILVSISKMVR